MQNAWEKQKVATKQKLKGCLLPTRTTRTAFQELEQIQVPVTTRIERPKSPTKGRKPRQPYDDDCLNVQIDTSEHNSFHQNNFSDVQ